MSDVADAFTALDLLLGHPGHVVHCSQCHDPITDHFGHYLPDAIRHDVDVVNERGQYRHSARWSGSCPYATIPTRPRPR